MKTKTQRVGINTAIAEAIATMPGDLHNDKPAIRQFLNDSLDNYGKSGFAVTFDYNQPWAVAQVQRGLRFKL